MSAVAKLTRAPSTDQGTFGVLTFGTQAVRTIELPWRNNRVRQSCIPLGVYRCQIVQSPKFGRVYGVTSVPGRSAVLIHSASDEAKFARIGVGAALGACTFAPGEQAELMAFGAHCESARAWGKAERAKLGL